MLKVQGLRLRPGEPESALQKKLRRELGCEVGGFQVLRRSVDARKKDDIALVYTVLVELPHENQVLKKCRSKKVSHYEETPYAFPVQHLRLPRRPVIVGAGPAGLFCALMLARAGARPILLERGMDVDQRTVDVAEKRLCAVENIMGKDTKDLVGRTVLLNMMVVIQPGISAPADMQGGIDMSFTPFHDLYQLRPVFNLLKIIVFHRSTGDNEAIVPIIFDLIKSGIEGVEILQRGVARTVGAGIEKLYINLNRRIRKLAHQLNLGNNFRRH